MKRRLSLGHAPYRRTLPDSGAPACERNTISITLRKPDYFQRTHQSYIDAGFYDRVQGTEKVESKDGELSRIYLSGNIPLLWKSAWSTAKRSLWWGNRLWENHLHEDAAALHSRDAAPYHHRGQPGAEVLQPENYVHLFYPADAGEGAIVTSDRPGARDLPYEPRPPLLAEVRPRGGTHSS